MKKIFFLMTVAGALLSCESKKEESKEDAIVKTAASDELPQTEFADKRYMQLGMQTLKKFESGDIDGWVADFSDNAVYRFSAGDSVAGKEAIRKYWGHRRKNLIQSIRFSNEIWLPVKINKSQKGPDRPGVWLLNWYQVNVTYTTGKSHQFWVHADMHYDENDRIDEVVQYMDRGPVNAALSAK